jgi:hypothetical protein
LAAEVDSAQFPLPFCLFRPGRLVSRLLAGAGLCVEFAFMLDNAAGDPQCDQAADQRAKQCAREPIHEN